MAGILFFVLLLGNLSEHTPKKYYDFLMLVHNSLGIIIFILVILRLLWRWSNPKPENVNKSRLLNKLSNLVKDAKNIITGCISNNVSTPVMSSTLNWYLNMSSEHNPSNLIQAQRDFFGAHTVQLLDSEEFLHLQWD